MGFQNASRSAFALLVLLVAMAVAGCGGVHQSTEVGKYSASVTPIVILSAAQDGTTTLLECRVTLPGQYTLGDNPDGSIEAGKVTLSYSSSADGPWTVLSADAVTGNSCQNISLKDNFGNDVVNGHIKRTVTTPGVAGDTVYFRGHFAPGGNIKAWENGVLTNQQLNSAVNEDPVSVVNGDVPVNEPPSVEVACAATVDSGASTDLTVTASDPEGDSLTFSYDYTGPAEGGSFDSSGFPTVVFSAPEVEEDTVLSLNVTANDGYGNIVTESCVITVVASVSPPSAALSATPTSGVAPLDVEFDASGSSDSDGTIVSYEFDFDGDAAYDVSGASATVSHTFTVAGTYNVSVRVTDDDGAQASASVSVTVSEPPADWAHRWGLSNSQAVNGLAIDDDSNVYTVGHDYGTFRPLLVKCTSDGDFAAAGAFATRFNSSAGATFIGADSSSGYVYVAGSNGSGALLIKYDDSGSIVWQRKVGGSNGEFFGSVAATSDGGAVCAGHATGASSSDFQQFVVKFEADGDIAWQVKLGASTGYDFGNGVDVDSSGNVYVSGIKYTGFGSGPYYATLTNLASDGSLQWSNSLEVTGASLTWGRGVKLAGDGAIYLTGEAGISGTGHSFVAKYDSTGAMSSLVTYTTSGWTSPAASDGSSSCISVGDDGRVLIGMRTTALGRGPANLWKSILVCLDSNLALLSQEALLGIDQGQTTCVAFDPQGAAHLACSTYEGAASGAYWSAVTGTLSSPGGSSASLGSYGLASSSAASADAGGTAESVTGTVEANTPYDMLIAKHNLP